MSLIVDCASGTSGSTTTAFRCPNGLGGRGGGPGARGGSGARGGALVILGGGGIMCASDGPDGPTIGHISIVIFQPG
jgi:hypothetical protein